MIKIKRRCRRGFVIVSMGNMTHISFETDRIKRRIRAKVGYIKDHKKWDYKAYQAKVEYREHPHMFQQMLMGGFMGIDDD